ncbi:protein SPIRAL1-like 3 [Primulina huaijiensis]|uniref:protein SPIRAL1-like 3 n=1 Tax=Primulina eburnea TaxID=1245227 RepID=UPI003C6C9ABA
MGRGVSAGGGQSSLGYLFGSGEAPKNPGEAQNAPSNEPPSKPSAASQAVDNNKRTPAGSSLGNVTNNYFRTDGQNCGNFITDRPSTKVHAAPGGGSSLNYLFSDGNK